MTIRLKLMWHIADIRFYSFPTKINTKQFLLVLLSIQIFFKVRSFSKREEYFSFLKIKLEQCSVWFL